MKLWPITTANKYFVKMLWHLLGECVKTTILLVCSISTFFFSINYIKSSYATTVFGHCSHNVLHYLSTVQFWWATLFYLFLFCFEQLQFFLFGSSVCFFFFFYIYCYTDITNFTIFLQLLRCQFFISQNKIIKYETMTNHNWK